MRRERAMCVRDTLEERCAMDGAAIARVDIADMPRRVREGVSEIRLGGAFHSEKSPRSPERVSNVIDTEC